MDSTDLHGIHVVDSTGPYPKEDHGGDEVARRRAHSTTSSLPRSRSFDEDREELEALRTLVAQVEGEGRRDCRGSIEPSLMGTVFGVVLAIILTITVYAFASLYRALSRKFYPQ